MPTTVTKSIRSSGGDYTSFEAWEAGEAKDLVAADEIAKVEFYNDWPTGYGSGPEALNSGSWNTDETRHPIVSVASGHRHDGTPQSGFFWKDDSGGNLNPLFACNIRYALVEWIDVHNTRPSGVGTHAVQINTVDALFEKVFARAAGAFGFRCRVGSSFNYPSLHNCVAWNCGDDGFSSDDNSRVNYIARNCGAFNCSGVGFNTGNTQSAVAINCVAFNNNTDFSTDTWGGSSDYNASGDTSASQFTNGITGIVSGDFVDQLNNDWHLASGSTLIDAGTDLSSDFTDDFDGEARSGSWDIGPDEVVSGGGTTVTVGLATETDSALSVSGAKARSVGQAAEADSALGITAARTLSIGQAVETDSALAATHSRADTVGLAVETDTALPVSSSGETVVQVGIASETSTALPLTHSRTASVGIAQESDTAQPVSHSRSATVGIVEESDTAQPITGAKRRTVGQAAEDNTAHTVTARKALAVGRPIEVSSALAVSASKRLGVGLAVETDSALGLQIEEVVHASAFASDGPNQTILLSGRANTTTLLSGETNTTELQ